MQTDLIEEDEFSDEALQEKDYALSRKSPAITRLNG
jgi:hypothetical protein